MTPAPLDGYVRFALCELPRPCLVRVPHWAMRITPGKSATPAPSAAERVLIASAAWAIEMLFVLMTPSQAHRRAAGDLRSKTWGSGEPGSLG